MNFARKAWHLLMLVVPAVYWLGWFGRTTLLWVAGVSFVVLAVIEALRFTFPAVQRGFTAVFGLLMREEEMKGPHGSIFFTAGGFLTILLFPREIACVAFVYLALGDTAAEVIGRRWGRVRLLGPKTLEGTLACFIISAAAGLLLLPWPVALAGAAAAAAIELLGTGNIDNATIPVGAGIAMYAVAYFL